MDLKPSLSVGELAGFVVVVAIAIALGDYFRNGVAIVQTLLLAFIAAIGYKVLVFLHAILQELRNLE